MCLSTLSVGAGCLVLQQPVLPYLDLASVSIGTVFSFARIGCAVIGCCYGRPSAVGWIYRETRVWRGIPRFYLGVRLFPVQAVEAAYTASLTLAVGGLVLRGVPGVATLTF
jgi:hypothetical protein